MSPAVEQMPPAANSRGVHDVRHAARDAVAHAVGAGPIGTCVELSQYIERDILSGAKIRFSTYSS